jgi:hypothetical protein
MCNGTGQKVLKTTELSKTVRQWWKNEPRHGCRCDSSTKKILEEQCLLIEQSCAATLVKCAWRRSQMRHKFKMFVLKYFANFETNKMLRCGGSVKRDAQV